VSLKLDATSARASALASLAAALSAFGGAARAALDVIYPPTCLACRRAVDGGEALCPPCWRAMRFIERPYCDRLGTPFEQDLGPGLLSPQAIADPPVYRRARAVARFEDGPARQLVHRLKYGDRGEVAAPLARWMARAGAEVLADADLIVPMPLHPSRLLQRQFNQAALLAQGVAKASQKRCALAALRRVKATRSQVGLTRAQRAENVQGAFRAAEGADLKNRNVLLVDDVLTSGATANAAARALLRAGALNVDVLVFARVVTGG